MTNSDAISFEISDMEITNELQSDGRSSSETSDTTINECQSNKTPKSEIQSPVSSTARSDSIAIENDSQDSRPAMGSIESAMRSSTHDGTTVMGDKASSQPQVQTQREIGAGSSKIAVSKESNVKSLEPLVSRSSNHRKVLNPTTTTRRSSRISKAPARYEDSRVSIHTSEVQKKEKAIVVASDKRSPELNISSVSLSPKPPIDSQGDDTSAKVNSKKETAVEFHPPRKGPGRPRKRQKYEGPPEEIKSVTPEFSHTKKRKLDHKALDVTAATTTLDPALTKILKPEHKTRGRGRSRVATNSTRKTRSQSSAKIFDSNLSDSLTQSPSTGRSSSPEGISKLDFAKLDTASLYSFIGDAINHYSSLPKTLGDPDGFKALYRTFFPSTSYQHYAKALGLEVSDLDLREAMRKIWEMVNGGENDKEVVLHRLGLSWAKKGASKKLL
ncbi:uncharacterized protein LAJ45_00322 [Morchella importuna]|uniref:uncharacterized protein n=1 Tax=Morchella importuna TaxID=1174673 RepID=UPI001E8E39B7|nr:uncharacterized protein LAJ45_00322 [Morchella importuna]KAH8155312.1 hypothetical protein LAJ45_00322 [Morchella importuna]